MLNLFKFKLRFFFKGPSKNINAPLILINQFVYIIFDFGLLNFLNSMYKKLFYKCIKCRKFMKIFGVLFALENFYLTYLKRLLRAS